MMPGAEPGGNDANQGASSFPGGFLGPLPDAARHPGPGSRRRPKGSHKVCDNQTVHGGVARARKKPPDVTQGANMPQCHPKELCGL
jgi:hypothetical protein